MAWYFLKIYVNCSEYFQRNRATIEQVALNPAVEYQTVYVPHATDRRGAAQSNTEDPPTYESLYKRI